MTPGMRLAIVSSRLLRAETFEMIVSPAIADLQFEAPRSTWPRRLQHYIAVWRAFWGAMAHDLAFTIRAPFADEARRVAFQSNVLTFASLALFQAFYYACMATMLLARKR